MSRNRVLLTVLASVVVIAVIIAVAVYSTSRATLRITASSSAPGTDAAGLLGPGPSTRARWTSRDEAVGASLRLDWKDPAGLDHVELNGTGDPSVSFTSASLTFDDGGVLLLTADADGNVSIDFPRRIVSTATITFATVAEGATAVSLSSAVFDSRGAVPASTDTSVEASASSGADPSRLTDGDLAAGDPGEEWTAAPDDAAPWVQLGWDAPREISSVQIVGPSTSSFDPAYSAAAPLHGTLVFDDGSEIIVTGIAGDVTQPTTIAFMPRMATSVRLELEKTISQATVALRSMSVYDAGTTPPRVPSTSATYATPLPDSTVACDAQSSAFGRSSDGGISLVCPTPGSIVGEQATIVVAAEPGTSVEVRGWSGFSDGTASGTDSPLAAASAGDDGRAVLTFSTTSLAHGPTAVAVLAVGADDQPLFVQLVNGSGRELRQPGYAPDGMTLQWAEEFTDPLSIAAEDTESTYAATKPAYWGTSEFGSAIFADPADGDGNISTFDDDYLRIRTQPLGGIDDGGFGREHLGGIVSSLHVGGTGFAAQYGYFEARILGAPGKGTWPAFWMMNTESTAKRSTDSAEIDAVELYGHNTVGSCHALHNYQGDVDTADQVECLPENGFSDWALTWHTYGVSIQPGSVTYYIDGIEVSEQKGLDHETEPYFFMLNLALGGGWPIDLDPVGNVSDLYVDWIRVYT